MAIFYWNGATSDLGVFEQRTTLALIRAKLNVEIMNLFPNSFKRTLGC